MEGDEGDFAIGFSSHGTPASDFGLTAGAGATPGLGLIAAVSPLSGTRAADVTFHDPITNIRLEINLLQQLKLRDIEIQRMPTVPHEAPMPAEGNEIASLPFTILDAPPYPPPTMYAAVLIDTSLNFTLARGRTSPAVVSINLGVPGIGPAGEGFAFSVQADGRITNVFDETVGRVGMPPGPPPAPPDESADPGFPPDE